MKKTLSTLIIMIIIICSCNPTTKQLEENQTADTDKVSESSPASQISDTIIRHLWTSSKYHYTVEIPKGYEIVPATGLNVDFKVENNYGAIVIVVKSFPPELQHVVNGKTVFDMIGDLKSYETEYIEGAHEFLSNPIFVKSGKTTVGGILAYWMDFTTNDTAGNMTITIYNKMYQFMSSSILYTISFTCDQTELTDYQPVWYRFINSFNL